MNRLIIVAAAVAGLILVGGVVFLATWKIPAPSRTIEKVVPNDRFPR